MKKNFKKVASENSQLRTALAEAREQVQTLRSRERRHPTDTNLDQGIDEQTYQELLRRVSKSLGPRFVTRMDFQQLQQGGAAPSPAYMARLEAVEREVLNNGGSVPTLLVRVDALEAARMATAIEVAGHVFIDEAATEAWAHTFADPNVHRFCVDFVSFFLLAEPKYESVEGGLEQMAAVVKAK
jgi:hypothetical protein